MRNSSTNEGLNDYLKLIGPGTIITILAFIIAYQFIETAPPRHISIATGSLDSADFAFGKAYSEILQKFGYTLEVINTAGAVENLQLLDKDDGGIDVAFLQGGIHLPTQSDELISLGSLYYDPLWVFHAAGLGINQLSELRGKRIDVGAEGSGTKVEQGGRAFL